MSGRKYQNTKDLIEELDDLLYTIDGSIDTIDVQAKFGMDEEQAIVHREMRSRGTLSECRELFKKLKPIIEEVAERESSIVGQFGNDEVVETKKFKLNSKHIAADRKVYKVVYKKTSFYLNSNLIKRQGITEQVAKDLISTHIDTLKVFEKMESTDDRGELKKLAAEVTELEFRLQELWGFDKNSDLHEWYLVPKCACAKMDNEDYRGTKFKIINMSCPVHGPEEVENEPTIS